MPHEVIPDDIATPDVVASGMFSRSARAIAVSAAAVAFVSCGRIPLSSPPPRAVLLLSVPIVIDSSTLRPISLAAESGSGAHRSSSERNEAPRIALVTTYQGSRYHAETIRAITDDNSVLARTAGSIANAAAAAGEGIFLDFQGATADDLRRLAALERAIADSARARSLMPIGFIVPPGDTLAYPTAVLARSADLIVVRLAGEHRPGTAPGAIASPEWIARQLGMRAVTIGVNRLVAELPLTGFLWNRDGSAREVTFADAARLVSSESGTFQRDPATAFLTASGRDGWTLWVPDGRTVEVMLSTIRRSGVNLIAVSDTTGAAPDVGIQLPATLRR